MTAIASINSARLAPSKPPFPETTRMLVAAVTRPIVPNITRNTGFTRVTSLHHDGLTRALRESGRHGADARLQLCAQLFGYQMSIDTVVDDLRPDEDNEFGARRGLVLV